MIKASFVKTRNTSDHRHFKDHQNEVRIFKRRVLVSTFILIGMIVTLIFRFYDLQVSNFQSYSTQSDRNRIQARPIVPNRGLVFDVYGEIIADNRAINTLTLTKERVKNLDDTLQRLSALIDISEREIKQFRKSLKWRRRPYEAIPLKYNLTEKELAIIAVNEYQFDGVEINGQLVRYYPHSELFTHVVGYVGRINEREQSAFTPEQLERYAGTSSIGKIGIEKSYEAVLHGDVGQENIETDARGRVLRTVHADAPVAGEDLHLFLDASVQSQAEEALAGRRGAVVAIDIKTGGVIAMLSAPSYNPNLFVTGISQADYSALNKSKDLPLFNRTIQGQYPPGSTVKPMLGLGGLESDVITPNTRIFDPGYYQLKNDERLYREWKRQGHGSSVNLHQAIVESCDIFFYDLGFRMGVDRMHSFGSYFGLGEKTNIDIPSERRGLWPSREWKKNQRGLNWYPGNSLNMSIGQGDVLATPLQLAVMTATLANRGTLIEPRLVKRIGDEETKPVTRSVYLGEPENWDLVLKSMKDVIHSYKGTAKVLSKNLDFVMAGKTGTAQVVSIAQDEEYDSEALSERNRDHAIFVGYAPYDDPKIAVAVVIENGEKSSRSGEVAKQVISKYLEGLSAQSLKEKEQGRGEKTKVGDTGADGSE